MKRHRHALVALAISAGLAACGSDAEEADRPVVETPPPPVESSEFAEFRGEVVESLDEIRTELDEMRDSVRVETTEAWVELSGAAERTRDEVMADVDRMSRATAEEARQIQMSAGERLAELESEVARRDIVAADDAPSVIEAINEHLVDLEADLDALREEPAPGDTIPPVSVPPDPRSLASQNDLTSMRERLAEIRMELDGITLESEQDFAETRDELGKEVAELTRDIRREWYEVRWGLGAV